MVLPRPTGPSAVGRTILHLVDERAGPLDSGGGSARSVGLTKPGTGGPAASYMTTQEARLLLQRKAPSRRRRLSGWPEPPLPPARPPDRPHPGQSAHLGSDWARLHGWKRWPAVITDQDTV